jgi:hypothetical protein
MNIQRMAPTQSDQTIFSPGTIRREDRIENIFETLLVLVIFFGVLVHTGKKFERSGILSESEREKEKTLRTQLCQ